METVLLSKRSTSVATPSVAVSGRQWPSVQGVYAPYSERPFATQNSTSFIQRNIFYFNMKALPQETVLAAIALLKSGNSYTTVTQRLGISKKAVHIIKKKYVADHIPNQGGRPKSLTIQDERYISRKIAAGVVDTAADAVKIVQNDLKKDVSADTVRRGLKRVGMVSRTKVKKPLLQPRHVKQRYQWALKYKEWTVEDWKLVIWSDETKINRLGSDGRKWCWKKPGEDIKARHVKPTLKFGGGSIMLWGCMTSEGPGFLAKIDNGLDGDLYRGILKDELKRTIAWYEFDEERVYFQQDNDPKHTAHLTMEYLKKQKYSLLDWPAQSPDLNPIEHLWSVLKRRLAAYDVMPKGVNELWERVEAEWDKITKEDCMALIESMPRRVAAVIKAKGRYTKY